MGLHIMQQVIRALEDKKNILITFKKDSHGDAIAAALALKLFFEHTRKKVHIACDGFVLTSRFSFIKESATITSSLGNLHQFLITMDISKNGLGSLKYDIKDETLRLFVTPKNGYFTRDLVRTSQTEFKYDAIIVLDTPTLSALGEIYTHNEEFFFKTPIINIDHKNSNELFGHINLVDLPASTTSEIVYELLSIHKPEYITKDIAEALLAGIIAGTNSFKDKKVRPHTLSIASKLVELGADRGYIIEQLFQNKTISTFKLWGTALTHLAYDATYGIVSTTLTRDDFVRANAEVEDLSLIIDELISFSPDAKIILILYENPRETTGTIHGMLKIIPNFHATEIMKPYQAIGDEDDATFSVSGTPLKEVEEQVIRHLKEVTTK
jgi:nanoRNase/pAp phosphatase (c-di-AMP/oligoRNAs hydrolase)